MSWCQSKDKAGQLAREQEAMRAAAVKTGTADVNQTFNKFDNKFYEDRQKAYVNYAMPQLTQQVDQANRQGFYGLANRGLQKSGAADTFGSNLMRETNVQKQGIVDQGINQAQQLQQQVEGQRAQVLAQLNASGDPTTASQQALAATQNFSAPSVFQPVGNLLDTFARLYANNALNKASNPNGYRSPYGLNNSALGGAAYSNKQ